MEFDLVFSTLFFIFPILFYVGLRVAGLKLLEVNIPSLVIISLFCFSYLGIFPLFFYWDDYRYFIGVRDKDLIFRMLLLSSVTITSLIVAFVFSRYLLKLNIKKFNLQSLKALNKKEVYFLIMSLIVLSIILFIYLSKLKSIALFTLVTNGADAAMLSRSQMGNDFQGKFHWYKVCINDLANLITFIFYGNFLISRKKSTVVLFACAFVFSTFTSIMATEKGPFVWLLVGLFFVHCIVQWRSQISFKKLAIFTGVLGTFLVIFFSQFTHSESVMASVKSIFSRSFAGSIMPAYFYLEYFPDHHDFLYGRTFPNPAGLFGFEPFRYTVEVMNWKFPSLSIHGVVGSAPTVFWGESYANFSYLGIFIIPFVVGVGVWVVSWAIMKVRASPIQIGFLVWVMLHYKDLAITGFSGYLVDFYLVIVALYTVVLVLSTNKFKIRINN